MIMVLSVVTRPSSPTPPSDQDELKGDVLNVLQELLVRRCDNEVVELVRQLVAENSALRLQLAEMVMRRRKGEGVSTAQLKLFLEELETEEDEALDASSNELKEATSSDDDADTKKRRKKKTPRQPHARQPFPPELRRIDNPINVPAEERACPVCGQERTCIGHDVTEVVELIPAELVVRVDRREKLACTTCEGELTRAPLADKVVPAGKFGCALVAALVVDKYRDGLPLHRQRQRIKRLGLLVPVSTLADQVTWATDLLRALWRAAVAAVLGSAVMQLDGTGIAVRDDKHPAKLKLGSLWGYVGDGVAAYLYTSTGKKLGQRPGELGPEDMLSKRTGYTVADAATLFDQSFKRDDLIECGCNMHARRYFKKALDAGDRRAALVIGAFKKMYEIEQGLTDKPPDERLAVRRAEIAPIYAKLLKWCRVHQPHEPPSTPMAAAIRYVLNHKLALCRFLEDGRIPMDNGAVERLHIRVALTRKNYLFAGSDAGAERAAIMYTILACCALAEVDPVEYLTDVMPRLARGIRLRDVADLLPQQWKAAREAATPSSAAAAQG